MSTQTTIGTRPGPAVSVVIPAHDGEQWITATIRSVLEQDFDHDLMEIIVVDNGSSDGTARVAAQVLDGGRVAARIVREQKQGAAHARNCGIDIARGEWLQLLDCDDLIHRAKISRQFRCAQSVPPDVGLVFSAWQNLGDDGEKEKISPAIVPQLVEGNVRSRVASLLATAGFLPTGSQLFRRSALLAVGGYREVGIAEDVDLTLRLAMGGWRFLPVPGGEALFVYRRHKEGSLSTKSSLALWDGVVRNASFVEEWARANGGLDATLKQGIVRCYFQAARNFAGNDWVRFNTVVARLEKLGTPLVPEGPPHLALLSNLIGYKSAERVAVTCRRMKRLVAG